MQRDSTDAPSPSALLSAAARAGTPEAPPRAARRRPELSLSTTQQHCAGAPVEGGLVRRSSGAVSASPSPSQLCLYGCGGRAQTDPSAARSAIRACALHPPRLSARLMLEAAPSVSRSFGRVGLRRDAAFGEGLVHASVETVGARPSMEDFLDERVPHPGDATHKAAFVAAVFDGHGGTEAAAAARADGGIVGAFLRAPSAAAAAAAASESFLSADAALLAGGDWSALDARGGRAPPASWPAAHSHAGTTVTVVAVFAPERAERGAPCPVACANVGDSGAFIFSRWRPPRRLTTEHSAEAERERVHAAGGVVLAGRVGGVLAIARALGDFRFKQCATGAFAAAAGAGAGDVVSARPSTCLDELCEDELLVVATDGLWNGVESPEALAAELFAALDAGAPLAPALELAARRAAIASNDNTTASALYFAPALAEW